MDQKTKVQSKRRPEEKKLLLNINGKDIEAREGQTILEAAREYDIYIPSLCFLEGVHQFGGCRMCMVEVEGTRNLVAACMVKAKGNMVVKTNSARVRRARKVNCELLLSNHPTDCLSCERSGQCELQDTARILGITKVRIQGEHSMAIKDMSPAITRDTGKCILCRRCVSVCNEVQGVGVLNAQGRGFQTQIAPAGGASIGDVDCTNCGQCVAVCPVGALSETGSIGAVWDAINDPDKRVVVQTAPAVRVGLGEEFGIPPGEALTGIMATALKEMMFDDVFDTNFGADLTVMEEGTEFIRRAREALQGGKAVLPMITSCSPGWVKFLEHNFPQYTANLSTCKSPHMMVGAISKAFYAKELGIDPKKMFVVSVMPCTAKKFEITRPEMENDGVRDVDAVITTRELARMIREVGIDFQNLAPSLFDAPLGLSSGAADIFGTTGGVMEAALRTIHEVITGRPLPSDRLNATQSPLSPGIKEAALTFKDVLPDYALFEGFTVRCAVASGFKDAKKVMDNIAAGESPYHFIEIMGCPGGCVAGGGQPRTQLHSDRKLRAEGLLKEDKSKTMRKAHENPAIKEIYETFLGGPLGDRSHHLLHTHYTKRGKYNELLEDKEKD